MALRILTNPNVDGLTGFLTCRVRAEDPTDPSSPGPEETLAISPEALLRRHHDPVSLIAPSPGSISDAVTAWLAHHHDAVYARKLQLDHLRQAGTKLAGKLLFADPPSLADVPPVDTSEPS